MIGKVSQRPRETLEHSDPVPGRIQGFQAKEDMSEGVGDIFGYGGWDSGEWLNGP